MIRLKELRGVLEKFEPAKIIIKRKKKMSIVKGKSGLKTKRINVIKVEIIE